MYKYKNPKVQLSTNSSLFEELKTITSIQKWTLGSQNLNFLKLFTCNQWELINIAQYLPDKTD